MCKPLVYRSKLTGRWTWDCEDHGDGAAGRTWEDAIWEAQLHRWIKQGGWSRLGEDVAAHKRGDYGSVDG